ncbi:MAG: major capsid protein P2 [Gallionella sp.]|nr:major capsid protein P2 [Gallionella sp.]
MSVGKLMINGLPHSNVVAAGTATSQITPGKTIESIMLQLGGTFTKAMITMLKLKANGKVILESTGSQLEKILAYRGYAANAAFLEIPFEDLTGTSELDRTVGSLDTSQGIQNITTEITIAGATAPTLAHRLYQSAQQKDRNGAAAPYAPVMCKLLRYPFSIANGGRLPITLPFGAQNGAIIKRVHIEHIGNLTGMTVKEDGLVIFEGTKAQNEYEQLRNKRVPQVNMATIDFVLEGNVREALDTRNARSMEWLLDFAAADNGFVLVEYLDVLGNL